MVTDLRREQRSRLHLSGGGRRVCVKLVSVLVYTSVDGVTVAPFIAGAGSQNGGSALLFSRSTCSLQGLHDDHVRQPVFQASQVTAKAAACNVRAHSCLLLEMERM